MRCRRVGPFQRLTQTSGKGSASCLADIKGNHRRIVGLEPRLLPKEIPLYMGLSVFSGSIPIDLLGTRALLLSV